MIAGIGDLSSINVAAFETETSSFESLFRLSIEMLNLSVLMSTEPFLLRVYIIERGLARGTSSLGGLSTLCWVA